MEDKYLDLLQHHPFQFAFPSSYKKNFLRILKAKLYPSEFTVATCDCLFPSTKINTLSFYQLVLELCVPLIL